MANQIAERIHREIERDQRRMRDEMLAQGAADLYARDGYIPTVPPAMAKGPTVNETPKRERIGRFYLVRHTGWYGLIRVDGTGSERWCANKKAAIEVARRITTREAEAERRKAVQHANG